MKNIDVAHAFFYDASGYFDKYYINVWYKNNKYYSYNTCIGELLHTTNGTSLVLAANRFSNTTCKHKADLIKACPYPIIELPQEYEAKEFKSDVVFKFIKGNIEVYSNSKLTRKENRYEFTQAYKQLTDMLIITKFKDFTYQLNALIEHYKLLYDTLTDSALLKKELQKRREKEAEKRKLLKEELNSFIKKHSYMDIIKFTFTDKYFNDTDVEAYNPQTK